VVRFFAFFLAFVAFDLFGKTKFAGVLFVSKINKGYLIDKIQLTRMAMQA
jgi:hypothetical protein